jgi:outer membrane cobalamin receptor
LSNFGKWILSARQSIRHPSFYELFSQSNLNRPSPLKNEKLQQLETGIETAIHSILQLKAYFYVKNIQQLITNQLNDSIGAFFNKDIAVHTYGSEFLVNWQLREKWDINAAVSFIENQNLYNYPKLSVAGKIQYQNRFFKDYLNTTVRIEGEYIGESNGSFVDPYSYSSAFKTLNPAFILNATAIFGFGNLNFYFMLENILNEDYQIVYGYPMNARMFRYGVRWEFWD